MFQEFTVYKRGKKNILEVIAKITILAVLEKVDAYTAHNCNFCFFPYTRILKEAFYLHMEIYVVLVILASSYFFIISISNIIFFITATKKPRLSTGPKVSVLVPARNEEDNLARCIEALRRQTYRNYEIIILDDNSTDRTYEIAKGFETEGGPVSATRTTCKQEGIPDIRSNPAGGVPFSNPAEEGNLESASNPGPKVSVIRGKHLPEDWYGKPFAMQQLAEAADGEYLLFTDADTVHRPDSVSWAVTNALHHKTDVLSGYPRHITKSLGEILVVPNIYLNTILFLPAWLVASSKIPLFSHAIGQYILYKASSFREAGGYGLAKQKITEDVYMSKEMKRRGYRVQFLDAKDHCRCRMYTGFKRAVNGISKNIYDFFEQKLYPLFILIPFFLLFFIAPVGLLIHQAITGGPYLPQITAGVGIFFIAVTAGLVNRRTRWITPLLYPLLFAVLVGIGTKSVLDDTLGKGYLWKGRVLR